MASGVSMVSFPLPQSSACARFHTAKSVSVMPLDSRMRWSCLSSAARFGASLAICPSALMYVTPNARLRASVMAIRPDARSVPVAILEVQPLPSVPLPHRFSSAASAFRPSPARLASRFSIALAGLVPGAYLRESEGGVAGLGHGGQAGRGRRAGGHLGGPAAAQRAVAESV